MSDMMPSRPPLYGSPWAPPDPAARYGAEPPHPGKRPSALRRALAVVVVLAIGLVLGLGGAAIIDHGRTGRSGTTATTAPAAGSASTATPSTAPSTPATTAPDSSATTSPQSVTSSTESLSEGVVDINTVLAYEQAQAAGTGMILTADGQVLTNNHVIDGATSISVTVVSTGKSYKAKVVGTDPSHDIAVLQLENASGLTPARIGDSSKVAVGDAVTAVGNAGGDGGEPTVASGHVTALGQEITASNRDGSNAEQLTNLIQVDANLQAGESGGPLYDAEGLVIGMNTAGSASFRARVREGYAIPINDALAIARQIQAGNDTNTITIGTPGFLGVAVQDSGGSGALVAEVVPDTPAAKIGLQAGDVLTSVDGRSISSAADVSGALEGHHGGDKIVVEWTDSNGSSHQATATLIDGPAD